MVEKTFTTEFATTSAAAALASPGAVVALSVLAVSASAAPALTTVKGMARLAAKKSVLTRLQPDEVMFILLQDNGIPAGKPSPYFQSRPRIRPVDSWINDTGGF